MVFGGVFSVFGALNKLVDRLSGHEAWRIRIEREVAGNRARLRELQDEVRDVDGRTLLMYEVAAAHGYLPPNALPPGHDAAALERAVRRLLDEPTPHDGTEDHRNAPKC
jgi:hypothetical protein